MSNLGSVLFLNANLPQGEFSESTYADLNSNIGNSYITKSLLKLLGVQSGQVFFCNNIWLPQTDPRSVIKASEQSKWIFLCLQDQLRTSFPDDHYIIALQLLRTLDPDTKMIAVSLCANGFEGYNFRLVEELSPARREFFAYLSQRCLSIGVRGEYTASILERMGIRNVGIVGCPSYFAAGPERQVATAEARRDFDEIGITGVFDPGSLPCHHYLQGDAEWPSITLLQASENMWRRSNGISALRGTSLETRLLSAISRKRVNFFTHPDRWESHIRDHCMLVCGSRLHGAIVALNAKVPSIVTNSDDRARESCEFFGIPYRPDFLFRRPTIEMLMATSDPSSLNSRYQERWKNFVRWLSSVGLSVSDAGSDIAVADLRAVDSDVVSQRVVDTLVLLVTTHAQLANEYDNANILTDPHFASDFRLWDHFSNTEGGDDWTVEVQTGGRFASTRAAFGEGTYSGRVSQAFDVEPSVTLQLSVDLMRSGLSEGGIFVDLAWFDTHGQLLDFSESVTADSDHFRRKRRNFVVPDLARTARMRFHASGLKWSSASGYVALRNPAISVDETVQAAARVRQ